MSEYPFQGVRVTIDWIVYLLKCSDGTQYTGITNDLDRRVDEHNAGKGARYTRTRLPVSVLGFRRVDSRSEALKLEWKVKQQPASQKLEFLVEAQ